MFHVAVLEPAPGKIAGLIEDWLAQRGDGSSVVLTRGDAPGAFSGAYDLFVVVSGANRLPALTTVCDVRCQALLVSSDGCSEAVTIPSKWVVSYGLHVRDSITVSSLEPNHAVLALQRELPTLGGVVLEQQELPLPIPPGTGAESVMALYGTLLILGIPPEDLSL